MTDLDRQHRRQAKLLVLFALSFGLWQGSSLIVDFSTAKSALQHTFIGMMILSGLFWFVTMVLLFGGWFSKTNGKTNLAAQDEWQQHITVQTMFGSYMGLLLVIGLGVLWVTMVGPLNGEIILRVLLIIAVLIPLLLTVILDKVLGGRADD